MVYSIGKMKQVFTRRSATMLLFLAVAFPGPLLGQQTSDRLTLYFSEVRAGKNPAIPTEVLKADHAKAVLTALATYQSDTLASVRLKVYTIEHRLGHESKQGVVRQVAVDKLVQGARDKDSGNAGLALDYLTTFGKDDFTAASKDSLRNILRTNPAHIDQVFKLIGFLELADVKETIRPYTLAGNPQAVRWAALVSLARMNDLPAINEVMRRVRKLPVNDDMIYKIFPDLVYTRHTEAIRYMVEVLYSDEKNCLSADAEREEPIPCAYRIMEQLAPIIDGYPLPLDESGDIKTNDYQAALKKVREWFSKHRNYTVLRDRF